MQARHSVLMPAYNSRIVEMSGVQVSDRKEGWLLIDARPEVFMTRDFPESLSALSQFL